jgi:hypothetical protein
MECAIRIRPLTTLDSAIEPLLVEAEQQGFEFMRRLVEDWASGANRFLTSMPMELAAFGIFMFSLQRGVSALGRYSFITSCKTRSAVFASCAFGRQRRRPLPSIYAWASPVPTKRRHRTSSSLEAAKMA